MRSMPLLIILSLAIMSILPNYAFGSEPCPASGYIHYGPSRQSVPCYLVIPDQPNPTFEEQFGNPTQTKLTHGDAILILNQTTEKSIYQSGEEITITPKLINIGNKDADITFWEPLFVSEIKNQTGKIWPPYTGVGNIPEYHSSATLKPGESFSARTSMFPGMPMDPFHVRLNATGNYTVISVARFTFDTNTNQLNYLEPLWSNPLNITIVPEFPASTTVILVIGIISIIILSARSRLVPTN